MPTVTSAIALGSNLGDRAQNLRLAAEAIARIPGCTLGAVSSHFVTAAVRTGAADPGGEFINAAALIETSLGPAELLLALAAIEASIGRVRDDRPSGGPREIDLDILLMGRLVMMPGPGGGPVIPHPALHSRLFVLAPLAEIAPEMVVPTLGRTVAELLAHVRTLMP